MSPYQIEVLLHYYTRAFDHRDLERDPPVWRPTIAQFMEDGLLESPGNDQWNRVYRLTERGKFYVMDGLCKVPLPVLREPKWEIPAQRAEAPPS